MFLVLEYGLGAVETNAVLAVDAEAIKVAHEDPSHVVLAVPTHIHRVADLGIIEL